MLYSQLQETVSRLTYKPGWQFWLYSGCTSGSGGSTVTGFPASAANTVTGYAILRAPVFLVIRVRTEDSGGGGQIMFDHTFAVPPEDVAVPWPRWLLDRVLDVERHEAMEFFAIGDARPFYPEHGPDADLYSVRERAAS